MSAFKRQDPAICVILQIVTLGFYYFIMLFKWLRAVNEKLERPICDPALAIMLTVVTCGLASIYFDYQVVASAQKIAKESSVSNNASAPLHNLKEIILFGSIAAYAASFASAGLLSVITIVFFLWMNCAIQYSVEYALGVAE